jgi:hypothetical protein
MSKQRSGLFNQRRAYQYQCCVPTPPPVKTIISMNYTMGVEFGTDGSFFMFMVDDEYAFVTLNTAEATNILLSVNDINGNPIIPSLDFLNNNTLKFTFIQGATISSTIIPPNSFVVDNVNNYVTLTSIDLTFTPNVTFINGPITIQIETL